MRLSPAPRRGAPTLPVVSVARGAAELVQRSPLLRRAGSFRQARAIREDRDILSADLVRCGRTSDVEVESVTSERRSESHPA